MTKVLDISQFIENIGVVPIIDVRSPKEFAQGHVPNAINIPIFTNDERAVVGTLYKQKGREEAIIKGLELVGGKLADFVRIAKQATPNKKLLVHCWRGGMRSQSMAWLFDTAGLQASTLEKGGIDLEGLAHHKGSSFGSIGQEEQPTSEQFENDLQFLLYQLLLQQSWNKIWLEDESSHIGRVYLPKYFWEQMQSSPVICLQVPKNLRIERLVKEYAYCDKSLLEEAIVRIRKRLGFDKASEALKALAQNDFAKIADIALVYYDKAYTHDIARRHHSNIYNFPVSEDNPTQTALEIIELAKNKGLVLK
ncbi:MAG: rhodanese-like domain-containing protein [Thermoflexibacter sp.]|nr:rhodanese-like domain-containing protein [Thermoflexibacter sp.]